MVLVPVPILIKVNRKVLQKDRIEVEVLLNDFISEINFGDTKSLRFLHGDDSSFAVAELTRVSTLEDIGTEFLNNKELTGRQIFEKYCKNEGYDLTAEQSMIYVLRCLDDLFKNISSSVGFNTAKSGIDIYILDEQGSLFSFNFINNICTVFNDEEFKYYSDTVDGFKKLCVDEDTGFYKYVFEPLAVSNVCSSSSAYSLITTIATMGYVDSSEDMLEGCLKVLKGYSECR